MESFFQDGSCSVCFLLHKKVRKRYKEGEEKAKQARAGVWSPMQGREMVGKPEEHRCLMFNLTVAVWIETKSLYFPQIFFEVCWTHRISGSLLNP